MSAAKLTVPVDQVTFLPNGEVEIRDAQFATSIREMQQQAEMYRVTTSLDKGGEINVQGCGKINVVCATTVGDAALILVRPDNVTVVVSDASISNHIKVAKSEKLSTISVAVQGYRDISL